MKITPKFFIRVLILFSFMIKKILYSLEITTKKTRTFINNVKKQIKNYFIKLKKNIIKIFKYIQKVYDTIIINVKKMEEQTRHYCTKTKIQK